MGIRSEDALGKKLNYSKTQLWNFRNGTEPTRKFLANLEALEAELNDSEQSDTPSVREPAPIYGSPDLWRREIDFKVDTVQEFGSTEERSDLSHAVSSIYQRIIARKT